MIKNKKYLDPIQNLHSKWVWLLILSITVTVSATSPPLTRKAVSTSARKNELLQVFKNEGIDGQSAVVRLILAETLASHCPAIEEGRMAEIQWIMKGIAKVIRNRAGTRVSDKELKVVFAKNQFNSSVAKYACSELEGFLNPESFEGRVPGLTVQQLWTLAESAYESAWKETLFGEKDQKVKNYYLHQHWRRGTSQAQCKFTPPGWVTASKEVKMSMASSISESVHECLGFYEL
jgi:hypothetical protein